MLPLPRRRSSSRPSLLFAVTRFAVFLLQLCFAVAVFRTFERTLEGPSIPAVAFVGAVLTAEVSI